MEESSKYHYHYTSIETLALILKYKTFRLRRLDLADDPEESLTNDYGNLGRFCPISCWTSMSEESLPMWQMYSKDMKGVRIKLPTFIFPKYNLKSSSHKRTKKNGEVWNEEEVYGENFYSYINLKDFYDRGCLTVPLRENILTKIIYTENHELLYPNVIEEKDGGITLHTGRLGVYKHRYWEFQQELRYKVFVSPWSREEILEGTPETHMALINRLKISNLPFEYIDLNVDEKKFEDMIIRLGPKVTEAEKIIVQSLVNEFNPSAKIEESVLKVR